MLIFCEDTELTGRPVSTFQLEAQMLKPAQRWLRKQGLRTKSEFTTPWGVCDLVGVALNERKAQRRLRQGQRRPLGRPARLALLHRIPDVEDETFITLARLEREFQDWFTPEQLGDELDRLVSWNFIVRPRRNSYQSVNGWLPLHKRIVAVELKLNRVEEALGQAITHLKIATESYVGLPAAVARRISQGSRRRNFEQHGIGLLAVHRSRCEVVLHAKAPENAVDTVFQAYCVERFWDAWVKGSST